MIYYRTKGSSAIVLRDILKKLNPNIAYFYSVFSKKSTINIIQAFSALKMQPRLIMAPRGTLKPSALKKSKLRKIIYLKLVKLLGVHKHFEFHATNEQEKVEIENIFGSVKTAVIPNFAPIAIEIINTVEKKIGKIKLISIGRFHPIKNFHFLIDLYKPPFLQYLIPCQ